MLLWSWCDSLSIDEGMGATEHSLKTCLPCLFNLWPYSFSGLSVFFGEIFCEADVELLAHWVMFGSTPELISEVSSSELRDDLDGQRYMVVDDAQSLWWSPCSPSSVAQSFRWCPWWSDVFSSFSSFRPFSLKFHLLLYLSNSAALISISVFFFLNCFTSIPNFFALHSLISAELNSTAGHGECVLFLFFFEVLHHVLKCPNCSQDSCVWSIFSTGYCKCALLSFLFSSAELVA